MPRWTIDFMTERVDDEDLHLRNEISLFGDILPPRGLAVGAPGDGTNSKAARLILKTLFAK
jgi:hypothetical protein